MLCTGTPSGPANAPAGSELTERPLHPNTGSSRPILLPATLLRLVLFQNQETKSHEARAHKTPPRCSQPASHFQAQPALPTGNKAGPGCLTHEETSCLHRRHLPRQPLGKPRKSSAGRSHPRGRAACRKDGSQGADACMGLASWSSGIKRTGIATCREQAAAGPGTQEDPGAPRIKEALGAQQPASLPRSLPLFCFTFHSPGPETKAPGSAPFRLLPAEDPRPHPQALPIPGCPHVPGNIHQPHLKAQKEHPPPCRVPRQPGGVQGQGKGAQLSSCHPASPAGSCFLTAGLGTQSPRPPRGQRDAVSWPRPLCPWHMPSTERRV